MQYGSDIPAEQAPCFTRSSFLKAPDWRYQAACVYLADEDAGRVPQIPTDPLVQYAVRALRAFRSPGSRELLKQCWDTAYKVFYLGTVSQDSAIVAEIESLLIQGAGEDDPEVQTLPFDITVYRLYADLFFDLSGMKAMHAWMHDYLFAPEVAKPGNSWTNKLRTRLMAYYGDRQTANTACVLGGVPANALALMKSLMSNERQRKLFDYMMHKTHLDSQNYAVLMEAAVKDMSSHDFAEHMKDREDAGTSTMAELAAGIEEGIRAFSQDELDSAPATGLDFVNQYTNSILNKD